MNLHKAKGLEAPVVFLACPCGEFDHDATQYIDRSSNPATGHFTIFKKESAYQSKVIAQPPGWDKMSEREREFASAEKDRLLYVAATRPKQMLVISLYPEQPDKCPWTPLVEGLHELRELQVPDFVRAAKTELTDGPDLSSVRDARRHRLQLIGLLTYSLLSVTYQTKPLTNVRNGPPKGEVWRSAASFIDLLS